MAADFKERLRLQKYVFILYLSNFFDKKLSFVLFVKNVNGQHSDNHCFNQCCIS